MRYKAGYKQEKRKELLEISGQLAKSQGFSDTGVDSFMKAANMTSGAFYSHFPSKQALFEALVVSELQQSIAQWENNPHQEPKAWIEFEIQRYLNLDHVHQVERGCVLPALASEIARSDETVKALYQQELIRGHALFTQILKDDNLAWAILSQMVGALLLARSIADENLKSNIINASKEMLFQILDIHTFK